MVIDLTIFSTNGIWLQVRWGIQRYLVCIKNLKIHKEKMIEKLLSRPSKMTGIRIDNASEYFIL